MTNIARFVKLNKLAVYHIKAGFVPCMPLLNDTEKDFFVYTVKKLSKVYFTKILGYCLMDNHFQLIVRMRSGITCSDDDIINRYRRLHDNKDIEPSPKQIISLRRKWSEISEFVKEIKQRFSIYYYERHSGQALTWEDHFKCTRIEPGVRVINSLANIDLHAVREGLVKNPERYRWSSLGYLTQTGNTDDFLSLDFYMNKIDRMKLEDRLRIYRNYVHEIGTMQGTMIQRQV